MFRDGEVGGLGTIAMREGGAHHGHGSIYSLILALEDHSAAGTCEQSETNIQPLAVSREYHAGGRPSNMNTLSQIAARGALDAAQAGGTAGML